ncbi:MAG: hypothetical protein ACI96W_002406 [Paraglaciecola sp.]|jgi:hypothetical protein
MMTLNLTFESLNRYFNPPSEPLFIIKLEVEAPQEYTSVKIYLMYDKQQTNT